MFMMVSTARGKGMELKMDHWSPRSLIWRSATTIGATNPGDAMNSVQFTRLICKIRKNSSASGRGVWKSAMRFRRSVGKLRGTGMAC